MSKEHLCDCNHEESFNSSISCAQTNSLLKICIAMFTASLMDASPSFLLREISQKLLGVEDACKNFLEKSKPHVAEFTRKLSALPRCSDQLPEVSFSLIRVSLVALSGMRIKDSARHIRAIPSAFDSPYSFIKTSSFVRCFVLSRHN